MPRNLKHAKAYTSKGLEKLVAQVIMKIGAPELHLSASARAQMAVPCAALESRMGADRVQNHADGRVITGGGIGLFQMQENRYEDVWARGVERYQWMKDGLENLGYGQLTINDHMIMYDADRFAVAMYLFAGYIDPKPFPLMYIDQCVWLKDNWNTADGAASVEDYKLAGENAFSAQGLA